MTNKDKRFPPEVYTEAEVKGLLAACSRRAPTGLRNRALIMVIWRCGLRISEALDLKPSDIDHGRGMLRVLDGKGHKPRTVGITDDALVAVDAWLEARKARGIRRGPLFCTLKGTRVHDAYVRQLMPRLADRSGLDKRSHAHGLRHTNAMELSQEGVSVPAISKHLGHSSLAVTAIYLDHIAPADVIAIGRSRGKVTASDQRAG